ncbi:MAG: acylphosphatase [Rhodopseudomonas sp.]|uniref:acylphosphatase n=1 Tax=Rhodopseudomonas sp. TaxID=1078 RepID=UPI00185A0331|nr:acylphosphatase [Rhodopseudomonas sp.]NVN86701.1 acylphosphatase [Rhodopseudomonas sp.]
MSDAIRQVMIRGRVQGVGYRAWVAHVASVLDVEGWVRNRRDGSVEALFAGSSTAVSEMVARCRRGPSAAQVAAVEDEPAGADALNLRVPGEPFSVLPTL